MSVENKAPQDFKKKAVKKTLTPKSGKKTVKATEYVETEVEYEVSVPQKVTVEYKGRNVTLPLLTPDSVPAGILRKTRFLPEEEQAMEIMWLMFEMLLEPEELAVLDTLTTSELEEVSQLAYEGDDLPK